MQAQAINTLAHELIASGKCSTPALRTTKPAATSIRNLPAWVDELFLRFSVIYKSRWTQEHVSPEFTRRCKLEWATERNLISMTNQELHAAIEHCKSHFEWPPTISEFVKVIRLVRNEIERARELEDIKSGKYLAKPEETQSSQLRREITKRLKEKYPRKRFMDLIPLIQQEIEKELINAYA